jgi:hypothetical protein
VALPAHDSATRHAIRPGVLVRLLGMILAWLTTQAVQAC